MGKNKRPKSFYIQSAKRPRHGTLEPGMKGFLCTSNGFEKDCVKEAYNLLNEYYKEETEVKEATLVEEVAKSDNDSEEEDLEAALKTDVENLQQQKSHSGGRRNRPFQQVECGARGVVFIGTSIDDPLGLALSILEDIHTTKTQKTQKLVRMIPIQRTCKAYLEDIERCIESFSAEFFKDKGQDFYVVTKVRNSNIVKEDEIKQKVSQILEKAHADNKANYKTPDVVVSVDVIKTVCCIGFLPKYLDVYAKYNLIELAKNKAPEEAKEEEKESGKTDAKEGNDPSSPNGTESSAATKVDTSQEAAPETTE